jgi:hypothetical protein
VLTKEVSILNGILWGAVSGSILTYIHTKCRKGYFCLHHLLDEVEKWFKRNKTQQKE